MASLLHCFQVLAGSAQARQVVLVKNWHGRSGRSEGQPDPIPGGNVSVWVRVGPAHPALLGVIPLSSLLLFLSLCAEVLWSAGNVQSQHKKRVCVSPKSIPWHGSLLGRGVPHQPARFSSQLLRRIWTWGFGLYDLKCLFQH